MTETDFDLNRLRGQRPEVAPPTAEATARARASLAAMTEAAMTGATMAGAALTEASVRSLRPARSRRSFAIRASTAAVLAGAAVAAAVLVTTAPARPRPSVPEKAAGPGQRTKTSPGQRTQTGPGQRTKIGGHAVLARLADAVLASPAPAGDATLVIRSQVENGGPPILGADLYTDSGEYFYAPTQAGLAAQVAAGNNLGNGLFGREVTAAEQAATGDLTIAAQAMENAPLAPGTTPPTRSRLLADDWLWEDSVDALTAGAGNPTVRAGVMRLLSTLSEVAVTNTTVNGDAVVTISADFPNPAKFAGSTVSSNQPGNVEQLTIDGTTGIPISFAAGTAGEVPLVQITYQVSRVTLAEVAQGHFAADPAASTSAS